MLMEKAGRSKIISSILNITTNGDLLGPAYDWDGVRKFMSWESIAIEKYYGDG